jgi:hypothetical protein
MRNARDRNSLIGFRLFKFGHAAEAGRLSSRRWAGKALLAHFRAAPARRMVQYVANERDGECRLRTLPSALSVVDPTDLEIFHSTAGF